MKKVSINAPVEYVSGHPRYGHYEGIIRIPDEDWEAFQENPIDYLYDEDRLCDLDFIVDDWEIDDCGEIDRVEWSECKS